MSGRGESYRVTDTDARIRAAGPVPPLAPWARKMIARLALGPMMSEECGARLLDVLDADRPVPALDAVLGQLDACGFLEAPDTDASTWTPPEAERRAGEMLDEKGGAARAEGGRDA